VNRFAFVDILKATGIISVVWIHSFLKWGEPRDEFCDRLGYLTCFAVPAFFFVAGFLQASNPCKSFMEFLSKKSLRLLVPYLIASFFAIFYRSIFSGVIPTPQFVVENLLLGSADGIFYFIPVLFLCMMVGHFVISYPIVLYVSFITLLVAGFFSWILMLSFKDFFWEIRNPFHWWGFFFFGATLALNTKRIEVLEQSLRNKMAVTLLASALLAFLYYIFKMPQGWSQSAAALQYVMVYMILGGVTFLFWSGSARSPLIWLSALTYPIYLYHRIFIEVLEKYLSPALVFAGTLICCVLFIKLSKIVFGRRAKFLFG